MVGRLPAVLARPAAVTRQRRRARQGRHAPPLPVLGRHRLGAALLDHVERATDLDLVAITDHERIDGALRAAEMHAAGDYSFELVVGEEITTRRGHVLALFLTERIPALRPLAETLERIHAQGGIAIAAHPMAPSRHRSARGSLRGSRRPSHGRRLDALELINPSTAGRSAGRRGGAQRRGARPAGRRQLGRPRARGHRHRLDLVPRLDRRRLPRGDRRRRRAPRGHWSIATTSRSTAASCGPRCATCGILCGHRRVAVTSVLQSAASTPAPVRRSPRGSP